MMNRTLFATLLLGAALAACGGSSNTNSSWTLEDLTADKGFSIRIPEFDVPSGQEVQDCYFFKMPDLKNGQDMWFSEFKTAINSGSHHMNLFRVKTIVKLDPTMGDAIKLGTLDATVVHGGMPGPMMSECWKSANWADWPLIVNSQNSQASNPYTDWKLPDGVASRVSPGEMLMLQTHYVNATTQKTPTKGRVGVNLYTFAGTGAPMELGSLFSTQQSIRVCQSNPTPKYSGTCKFAKTDGLTIVATNGHFHSRGKEFDVYTWDGMSTDTPPDASKYYTSLAWDDPPMMTGLNQKVPSGGGIYWTCSYQWEMPAVGCDAVNARDKQMANDCCYTFGPIVETSEHCNVFAYYYPKGATDVGCF
jgi:hypothetical protein